jgi:hypothetical protein
MCQHNFFFFFNFSPEDQTQDFVCARYVLYIPSPIYYFNSFIFFLSLFSPSWYWELKKSEWKQLVLSWPLRGARNILSTSNIRKHLLDTCFDLRVLCSCCCLLRFVHGLNVSFKKKMHENSQENTGKVGS